MDLDAYDCLSFDCYGTLIDWETGLVQSLRPVLRRHDVCVEDESLLESFGRAEAAVQSEPFRLYREVLKAVLVRLGAEFGFSPSADEQEMFAASVADWPPFADATAALERLRRRYRLVVLSNVDDDLFRASAQRLGVEFDAVFTAERIGSYKPGRANFEHLLAHAGVERERLLHVAQSLYHDVTPAQAVGLSTVWVNRRAGKTGSGATVPADAKPDLEVPDLRTLADLAGLP